MQIAHCSFLNAAAARRALLCAAAAFSSQTCWMSNGLLIFFSSSLPVDVACLMSTLCVLLLFQISVSSFQEPKSHLHVTVPASESNLITFLAIPLCESFT